MGKIIIVILIVFILMVVGPIAIIWGLNTLFSFSIAYTLKNWLACLILAGAVNGSKTSSK